MTDPFHFEDFAPGQTFDLGSLTVSRQEIVDFAAEYDPQPFHLDEDAGRASMLGGLAASGWHTCSLVMSLLATGLLNNSVCRGSPGIDRLQWRRPVFPGDTLSAKAEVVETRALRSKPDLGMVTIHLAALNQSGATVLIWENPILFLRRRPEEVQGTLGAAEGSRKGDQRGGQGGGRTDDRAATGSGSHPAPEHLQDGRSGMARFFEDLQPGDTFDLGHHTFSEEEIVRFASKYDPQPYHLSQQAAAETFYGRLFASGWHSASVFMKLFVASMQAAQSEARSQGRTPAQFGPSPGFETLRWHRPVHPGDTLHYARTITDKVESRSRPEWGLVHSLMQAHNQNGELVFSFAAKVFVQRVRANSTSS